MLTIYYVIKLSYTNENNKDLEQDTKITERSESNNKGVIEKKDSFVSVQLKSQKRIFIDNLLGGMAWGVGSVLGATIIVGVLGLIIIETKKIPLLGNIVTIIQTEIKTGATDLNNITKK